MPRILSMLLVFALTAVWTQRIAAAWPEVGPNDLRITFEGGTGTVTPSAWSPDVAVDDFSSRLLMVFLSQGESLDYEIAGQFTDFEGTLSGPRFFIASPESSVAPRVSFNSVQRHFLVMWRTDDGFVGRLVNESGVLIGSILSLTSPCDINCSADLVYNPTVDEFLLVFDQGGEIKSQRLDGSSGEPLFAPAAISQVSGSEFSPRVVLNRIANEYLVAWISARTTNFQVHVQRLDGVAAGQVGFDDRQVSTMKFGALSPSLAHNPATNEYLLAWSGSDPAFGLAANEQEIFCQRLNAAAEEIGQDDFRISGVGGLGNIAFQPVNPRVAYSQSADLFLVVWFGDHNQFGLVNNEFEVFGQFLDPFGGLIGPDDFNISDAGGIGNPSFSAITPVVISPRGHEELLTFWSADEDIGGMVDDEREIFFQRLGTSGFLFNDGFESGSSSAWSKSTP